MNCEMLGSCVYAKSATVSLEKENALSASENADLVRDLKEGGS